MKVLLATSKPFASQAVNGIQNVIESAGYTFEKLENYSAAARAASTAPLMPSEEWVAPVTASTPAVPLAAMIFSIIGCANESKKVLAIFALCGILIQHDFMTFGKGGERYAFIFHSSGISAAPYPLSDAERHQPDQARVPGFSGACAAPGARVCAAVCRAGFRSE